MRSTDFGDTETMMTWDEAVAYVRSRSEYAELIRDAYLDENPLDAANRYERGEEFLSFYSLLSSRVSPGASILDLGAGNGILSYALSRKGYRVAALEPDPSKTLGRGAIRFLAESSGVDISVIDGWGESIPESGASWDGIVARQVLHHARSLGKMCKEVFRVLKPGGVFFAIREHVIRSLKDKEIFFQIHPLHRFYGGENAFLLKEYLRAFREAGFSGIRSWGFWETPINYAPLSSAELQTKLSRRLPFVPQRFLREGAAFRRMAAKAMNYLFFTPGCLYSFMMRKQL